MIHTSITADTLATTQAHVARLQASCDHHSHAPNSHNSIRAQMRLKDGVEALMTAQNAHNKAMRKRAAQ